MPIDERFFVHLSFLLTDESGLKDGFPFQEFVKFSISILAANGFCIFQSDPTLNSSYDRGFCVYYDLPTFLFVLCLNDDDLLPVFLLKSSYHAMVFHHFLLCFANGSNFGTLCSGNLFRNRFMEPSFFLIFANEACYSALHHLFRVSDQRFRKEQ